MVGHSETMQSVSDGPDTTPERHRHAGRDAQRRHQLDNSPILTRRVPANPVTPGRQLQPMILFPSPSPIQPQPNHPPTLLPAPILEPAPSPVYRPSHPVFPTPTSHAPNLPLLPTPSPVHPPFNNHPPQVSPTVAVAARRQRHGRQPAQPQASHAPAPAPPQPQISHAQVPAPPLPRGRQPYTERQNYASHDLGGMVHECKDCHALHWRAEKLSKSTGQTAATWRFGLCCSWGDIKIPYLPEAPAELRTLFTAGNPEGKSFRENIRRYNNAFAFTSIGVKLDQAVMRSSGPYCFKIMGELSHCHGTLLPDDGEPRAWAQHYIHDQKEVAIEDRLQANPGLNRDTMVKIYDVLHQHNPFPAIYQHAYQVLQAQEAEGHGNIEHVKLRVVTKEGTDQRRYNLPAADEIAVIIPNSSIDTTDSRDIIVRLRPTVDAQGERTSGVQRIRYANSAYAPLHYPLLFPQGEPGWTWKRYHQRNKSEQVTLLQYTAFRIHPRPLLIEGDTLLRGGRLFQEYLCDAWAMVDQDRLRWIRKNQSKLRAEVYKALASDTVSTDDMDPAMLGRRIILPSTYIGGARHMNQLFQDSMAITRFEGKPDLFLTMTTNPRWPEILAALLPGQDPSDRPDIVARVFNMKKNALLNDIFKQHVSKSIVTLE